MTEPRPDELRGGAEREPLRLAARGDGRSRRRRCRRRGVPVDPAGRRFRAGGRPVAGSVPLRVAHAAALSPTQVDVQPPLSQPGPFGIQAVCARTDHRQRLTVVVDVSNGSLDRVTVLDVTAELPIGGPTLTAVTLPAKPCSPEAGGRALLMRPRGTVSAALQLPAPARVPDAVPGAGRGLLPRAGRAAQDPAAAPAQRPGRPRVRQLLAVTPAGGARRSRPPRSGSTRRASAGCSTRARSPSWC